MKPKSIIVYLTCTLVIPVVLLGFVECMSILILANRPSSAAPDNHFVYPDSKMKGLYHYRSGILMNNRPVTIKGDLAHLEGGENYAVERSIDIGTTLLGYKKVKGRLQPPYDIIVLGDSFGAGYGSNTNTADYLAENYSVYNLSIGGSPWNQLMTMRYTFRNLELKDDVTLIWLLFEGNDLSGEYGDMDLEPYGDDYRQWVINMWRASNTRTVARQVKKLSSKTATPNPWLIEMNGRLYLKNFMEVSKMNETEVKAHPNFHKLAAVFDEMELFGVRIVVLCVPTKERVELGYERSGFSKAIESLVRERNFGFMDLTDTLRQEETYWADDTHWNERGHELVGGLVKGYLSK